MKGQIALVTGANTGVGLEVVRALARKGLTVYLGSRNEDKGRQALQQVAHEGDIRLAKVDLTDEPSMKAIVARIAGDHGKLDSLVNNAGVAFADTVLDARPEQIRESMDTNVHGPLRLAILALELLRKSDQARVVNVSSMTSLIRWIQSPDPRSAPDRIPYSYSLAKAAQNAATIMLANALLAEGIKVNSATPGYGKSQLSRFLGTKSPADGARIIVELATLGSEGPTGGFFDDTGQLEWC